MYSSLKCVATIACLQGAVVYVSGSAEKMPQAVATAFEEIAAQQHQEPGFGRKFVQRLEQTKRYHVEAWS